MNRRKRFELLLSLREHEALRSLMIATEWPAAAVIRTLILQAAKNPIQFAKAAS